MAGKIVRGRPCRQYVMVGLSLSSRAAGEKRTGLPGSGCVTYLEYEQTETTLRKYNIVATLLENVKNWWISFTPEEKEQQPNKDRLIVTTESALREEGTGWMSLLRDAVSRASDADRLGG